MARATTRGAAATAALKHLAQFSRYHARHSGTGQRELLLNRRALDVVLFLLQSSHSQNPASGSGEHMAMGFIISFHLVITLFPMSLKCARCQILFQHFAAWFYEVANTVKNSRLYD